MVTLYRPGNSAWHRLPAGPKAALLAVLTLGISLLPLEWWATAVTVAAAVGCYLVPGIGLRQLVTQLGAIKWVLAVTAVGQLVFLGPTSAVANTARVAAVLAIASLLALTTQVTALLEALERGLRPLSRVGVDPQRVALLLAVTLNTLPALAGAAQQVRQAQLARGGRPSLRRFAAPFLVVALKHADELGDALTARGVR